MKEQISFRRSISGAGSLTVNRLLIVFGIICAIFGVVRGLDYSGLIALVVAMFSFGYLLLSIYGEQKIADEKAIEEAERIAEEEAEKEAEAQRAAEEAAKPKSQKLAEQIEWYKAAMARAEEEQTKLQSQLEAIQAEMSRAKYRTAQNTDLIGSLIQEQAKAVKEEEEAEKQADLKRKEEEFDEHLSAIVDLESKYHFDELRRKDDFIKKQKKEIDYLNNEAAQKAKEEEKSLLDRIYKKKRRH